MGQKTGTARPMGHLYRSNGLLTRDDTFQPVFMLIRAIIQMNFIWPNHGSQYLRIACIKCIACLSCSGWVTCCHPDISPRHENPPLASFKLHSVGIIPANVHGYPIGIFCRYFKVPMYVPKARCRKLCRTFQFNGAGIFRSHSPMSNINMMGTPSGDHACAKLLTTQPTRAIIEVCLGMNPVQGI